MAVEARQTPCFFTSDLHGSARRYGKLFWAIAEERPSGVFLGGDLLPPFGGRGQGEDPLPEDFVRDFLAARFEQLRRDLGEAYPRVFLILGNDDLRAEEEAVLEVAGAGTWEYLHNRRVEFGDYSVFGYAGVPPTPFRLKDWERYDISRHVDPGAVSPEEGLRSVEVEEADVRYGTIEKDLRALAGEESLDRAIFLFHSPPYQTKLDRAALDGQMVDHVPLDVHVGSVAIRRFIETRQPRLTLHGHVHESAQLTGAWQERIGWTHLFSGAHRGPELALIRFAPEALGQATRELL